VVHVEERGMAEVVPFDAPTARNRDSTTPTRQENDDQGSAKAPVCNLVEEIKIGAGISHGRRDRHPTIRSPRARYRALH